MREKERLEGGCESEDFKCINYDREKYIDGLNDGENEGKKSKAMRKS